MVPLAVTESTVSIHIQFQIICDGDLGVSRHLASICPAHLDLVERSRMCCECFNRFIDKVYDPAVFRTTAPLSVTDATRIDFLCFIASQPGYARSGDGDLHILEIDSLIQCLQSFLVFFCISCRFAALRAAVVIALQEVFDQNIFCCGITHLGIQTIPRLISAVFLIFLRCGDYRLVHRQRCHDISFHGLALQWLRTTVPASTGCTIGHVHLIYGIFLISRFFCCLTEFFLIEGGIVGDVHIRSVLQSIHLEIETVFHISRISKSQGDFPASQSRLMIRGFFRFFQITCFYVEGRLTTRAGRCDLHRF